MHECHVKYEYQRWRDGAAAPDRSGSMKYVVDPESGTLQAFSVDDPHTQGFACICVFIDSGASGSVLPSGERSDAMTEENEKFKAGVRRTRSTPHLSQLCINCRECGRATYGMRSDVIAV